MDVIISRAARLNPLLTNYFLWQVFADSKFSAKVSLVKRITRASNLSFYLWTAFSIIFGSSTCSTSPSGTGSEVYCCSPRVSRSRYFRPDAFSKRRVIDSSPSKAFSSRPVWRSVSSFFGCSPTARRGLAKRSGSSTGVDYFDCNGCVLWAIIVSKLINYLQVIGTQIFGREANLRDKNVCCHNSTVALESGVYA